MTVIPTQKESYGVTWITRFTSELRLQTFTLYSEW